MTGTLPCVPFSQYQVLYEAVSDGLLVGLWSLNRWALRSMHAKMVREQLFGSRFLHCLSLFPQSDKEVSSRFPRCPLYA